LLNERRLGDWNRQPIVDTEEALKRGETPPGGEAESQFRSRISDAARFIEAHLARSPLVVSSKGVGRVLNTVLGGPGRLLVGNAELVQFRWQAGAGGIRQLEVCRPWASDAADPG
jgi:probable phosphoglycerate mutase